MSNSSFTTAAPEAASGIASSNVVGVTDGGTTGDVAECGASGGQSSATVLTSSVVAGSVLGVEASVVGFERAATTGHATPDIGTGGPSNVVPCEAEK